MVHFWLTSIVFLSVPMRRKVCLVQSGCARQGRCRGSSLRAMGPDVAKGLPPPRDPRARTSAWGLHELASPSQQPDL